MTRSTWVLLCTIAAVTTLEASKKRTVCSIKGEIHPIKAIRKVWLIRNGDTIPASITGSRLNVDVKPGVYDVWIDAIAPYQDHLTADIDLYDNITMELGNIELLQ